MGMLRNRKADKPKRDKATEPKRAPATAPDRNESTHPDRNESAKQAGRKARVGRATSFPHVQGHRRVQDRPASPSEARAKADRDAERQADRLDAQEEKRANRRTLHERRADDRARLTRPNRK